MIVDTSNFSQPETSIIWTDKNGSEYSKPVEYLRTFMFIICIIISIDGIILFHISTNKNIDINQQLTDLQNDLKIFEISAYNSLEQFINLILLILKQIGKLIKIANYMLYKELSIELIPIYYLIIFIIYGFVFKIILSICELFVDTEDWNVKCIDVNNDGKIEIRSSINFQFNPLYNAIASLLITFMTLMGILYIVDFLYLVCKIENNIEYESNITKMRNLSLSPLNIIKVVLTSEQWVQIAFLIALVLLFNMIFSTIYTTPTEGKKLEQKTKEIPVSITISPLARTNANPSEKTVA